MKFYLIPAAEFSIDLLAPVRETYEDEKARILGRDHVSFNTFRKTRFKHNRS